MSDRRTFGHLRQFGETWWVRYRVGGEEKWENLHTTSVKVARDKAAVIGDRVGKGEHTPADARRFTFAELEQLVRDDYRKKARRSVRRLDSACVHLREAFGGMRALAITAEAITKYELERLEAGAFRASVNYELAMLRRMFRLAVKARRLPSVPSFSIPDPRNARVGFFEADDFAAVLEYLPEPLRQVSRFAYVTGWRVPSEVLTLTWRQVDFAGKVIRLEPNTTKNDEGRTFPFGKMPELEALLEAQRAETKAAERETGSVVTHVFHRDGKPIADFRKAWKTACDRAARGGSTEATALVVRPNLVGRIPHDFRRTAARNLERAGVPRTVAMKLVGHKTESMYRRYAITNEADLSAGVEKLTAYLAAPATATEVPAKRKGGNKGEFSPSRRVANTN